MSERTFDEFDEYAKDYRSIHSENVKLSGADSMYFAEMKVKLLASYETNQKIHVLDVGCGDGATEQFMAQLYPAWKIEGIDVSEKSIQQAKQRKISSASFSVYDGIKTTFSDESFDLIFIAGVFHHVSFNLHHIIMKEIKRVLKKSGRVYFFEHNPTNPVTKYLVKTCVFDKTARLLNYRYAKAMFHREGLKIAKTDFIIFFPRKGLLSKFIFLEKYLKWLPLGGQYFIRAIK